MHEPPKTALDPASTTSFGRMCLALERGIGQVVELVVGLLVLAETIILFAGVYSRYVLRRPFVCSD